MKATSLRDWTQKIKARDYYRCRVCGQDGDAPLEAHHIIGRDTNPSLLLDTENGITLCGDCHRYIHSPLNNLTPDELSEQIYTMPKFTRTGGTRRCGYEIKATNNDIVSYFEAASILQVSRQTVYAMIRRDELHPFNLAENRFLHREEVERLRDGKHRSGKS